MLDARPAGRVLCASDLGPASAPATRHAVALAQAIGARLELLHARTVRDPAALENELRALVPPGLEAEVSVVPQAPVEAILRRAAGAEVVVLGTHGREGLARMFLGSVAEDVMRACATPVMVVPAGCDTVRPVETIVCPVDLSDLSAVALRHAVGLARRHGAAVHAVHAWDLEDSFRGSKADLSEALAGLVRNTEVPGVQVSWHLRFGPPEIATLDAARDLGADWIVMATAGRRGMDRFVLGSVVEGVVRRSPIPVWTLREATSP